MPAFSFTAPQITEEDERREKEALTQEERKRLEDDLYGSNDLDEHPEMTETAAAYCLQQAMMQIPAEQKEAYLEALERAPELVAKESPAIAFMRCENYDAAVRGNALGLKEEWHSPFVLKFFSYTFSIFTCFFRPQQSA